MNINANILKQIDEIRNDKIHGASYLARQAVSILKYSTECSQMKSIEEFLLEQKTISRELMSARPAMAPISNIIVRLLETITFNAGDINLAALKQLTSSTADMLINDSYHSIARIAEYGASLIKEGFNIMTHSYSSTIIAFLNKAFSKSNNITVTVTSETTARELGEYGIPIKFINGMAMGIYISTIDIIIVGADRVCADGSIINGIGTYLLALASEKAGVPFYIACDTLKFDPIIRGSEVDLEEKESSELIEPAKLPSGTVIKNPYFDVTSPELVTGIITENGILTVNEVFNYMKRN